MTRVFAALSHQVSWPLPSVYITRRATGHHRLQSPQAPFRPGTPDGLRCSDRPGRASSSHPTVAPPRPTGECCRGCVYGLRKWQISAASSTAYRSARSALARSRRRLRMVRGVGDNGTGSRTGGAVVTDMSPWWRRIDLE